MAVFIDTSAIIALVAAPDQNHATAGTTFEALSHEILVLSEDIFDEVVTNCRRLLGFTAAIEVGTEIRENHRFRIEPLLAEDREQAWALFQKYGKDVQSLTDCSSAALMDRLGIERVFTFDRDFRILGKTVIVS